MTIRDITGAVKLLNGQTVASGTVTAIPLYTMPADSGGIVVPIPQIYPIINGSLSGTIISPGVYRFEVRLDSRLVWRFEAGVAESDEPTTLQAVYLASAAAISVLPAPLLDGDDAARLGSGVATDGYVLTADGSGGTAWEYVAGGGGGGASDHGSLSGLSDDDHPQYHNDLRGDSRYYTKAQVSASLAAKSDTTHNHDSRYYTESEIDLLLAAKAAVAHTHLANQITDLNEAVDDRVAALLAAGTGIEFLYDDAGNILTANITVGGEGGVTDHGALTGLSEDDHPQYLNNARGDARYYTQGQVDTALATKEASLGNPASSGQVLASTTGGVRSWVDLPGGTGASILYGNVVPLNSSGVNGDSYVLTLTGTLFKKVAGSWVKQTTDVNNPLDFLPANTSLSGATDTERTTAFQAAITAAQSGTKQVEFTGGWHINGTLEIADYVKLVGKGQYTSQIIYHGTSGTALYCNPSSPTGWEWGMVLRDFSVLLYNNDAVTPDSTCKGIVMDDQSTFQYTPIIENVFVYGFYIGVELNDVRTFDFCNLSCNSYRLAGLRNVGTIDPDKGDCRLRSCWFHSPTLDMPGRAASDNALEGYTYASGILWHYGSALNVIDIKCWGVDGDVGINIDLNATTGAASVTGQFKIIGGSIETQWSGAGIRFDSAWGRGGAGTAHNGNRCIGISVVGTYLGANKGILVESLPGALMRFVVAGGTEFDRGAVATFSNMRHLSVTGCTFNNKNLFNDELFTTSKDITITGTIEHAKARGNDRFGFTDTDLPDTVDASEIVASGTRAAGKYLEATNAWSVPEGASGGGGEEPPAGSFISQTFSDGTAGDDLVSEYVPSDGTSWSVHSGYAGDGAAEISSNGRVKTSATTSVAFLNDAVTDSADYSVEITATSMAIEGGGIAALGRAAGTVAYDLNCNGVSLILSGGDYGPANTWNGNIVTYSLGTAWGPGEQHTIKLEMIGSTIKGYYDGVEVISVTNTLVTAAGGAGFYINNASNSETVGKHIDSIVAVNI